MNREIEFRAKVKDGSWRYGFVMNWAGNAQIWENTNESHNFIIEEENTIGQFTGLRDCEGSKIYEGDTLIDLDVELEEGTKLEDTQQQVYWCGKLGCWKLDNTFKQNKESGYLLANDLKDFRFKIHSNIHDNKSNLATEGRSLNT